MGTIPGQPAEPVAWVNLRGPSRVFYTSLGHPGDFDDPGVSPACSAMRSSGHSTVQPPGGSRQPEQRPPVASDRPPREHIVPFDRGQGPLAPRAALAAFTVPDDLQIDLVLAEPVVRQPVSI